MQNVLERQSTEYIEILAEVFAEIVQKGAQANHGREKAGSDVDVTPSLVLCLQYLYLHGEASVRKIARGLGVSLPAASQLVERCVKKGMAVRAENESDRRLATVYLTDKGRELVSDLRNRKSEWFSTLLESMSDEKRAALVDSLEEFIKLALMKNEGSIEGACVRCGIDHLAFCVVNRAHVAATGEPVEDI
jgi:DNA-binding MarR family transcriptional regulator